ncbi:MAG: tetratricopeptide repeat protein [Phycisphaerales bacterium]|nr:tetratricopeptide repeat protein [Phycisphaerales bacterium]
MDALRYEKLKAVFNEACESPIHERAALIEAKCAGDDELQREVESMLAHIESPAVDLDSAARGIAIEWGEALREERTRLIPKGMPERIGPFTMISVLGQGGMGVVYLAQQDKPQRQVALKLIRPDLTSSDVMHRFDRETRALGRLQHPGIAQIFEAGIADVGGTQQPYIAMEYVRGRTLLKYADEEGLGTRERLALMEEIAHAVEHAHQQGVIHRDLKPANIVVDERGQPRVLDFGIARTTDEEARTQTLRTGVGQLIGTLPYMSPEQVSGEPDDVDTRSDVYALGVICFELLTGQLPVNVQDRSIPEAVRVISQTEPTRLGAVNRMLRGDLDTIVAKALEHDKDQRYASAGAMADDIRRYLNDEPILARPASAMYQLRKLARRNKALVVGTAAVLVVLVAGLIASSWGWMSALKAQRAAEREAARATQVSAFMQNILSGVDPEVARTMDTQLLQKLLEQAVANIATGLTGQPLVEADVQGAIGRTYRSAGLAARAEGHLRRAIDLYQQELGSDAAVTGDTKLALGSALMDMGRFAEAEPQLTATLGVARGLEGSDEDLLFRAMNALGGLYFATRRLPDADKMLSGALEIARRSDRVSDHIELLLINNVAALRTEQGRIDEARALREEAYSRRVTEDGPDAPDTLKAQGNLAVFYDRYGPRDRVLDMYQEVYTKELALFGPSHTLTMSVLSNLASELLDQGQTEEAKRRFEELIGLVSSAQCNPMFAAMAYRTAANAWVQLGDLARADELTASGLEIANTLPEGQPIVWLTLASRADVLIELGRFAEAEACLQRWAGLMERLAPEDDATRAMVAGRFADLYDAWGKADEAKAWRDKVKGILPAVDGSEGR